MGKRETEVAAKAQRRRFTAEYKLQVLAEAERCHARKRPAFTAPSQLRDSRYGSLQFSVTPERNLAKGLTFEMVGLAMRYEPRR